MLWIVSFAFLALSDISEDGRAFHLGGPRDVHGEVLTVGSDYVIVVRFLAVQAFDKTTNKKLNIGKGKKYAFLALAQHLHGGNSVQLSLTGVRVKNLGEKKRYHRLRVTVSKNDVKISRESAQKKPTSAKRSRIRSDQESVKQVSATIIEVRFNRSSPLLARKQDYLDTIVELFSASNVELSNITSIQDEERFLNAIVDAEDTIVGQLDVLSRQIAKDRLFLSNERDDLDKRMTEQKSTLFTSMRTIVKRRGQITKQKKDDER